MAASKGGTEYQAHTYPTKIPPAAIHPFIEAFTSEGDVVLDPFCGSGMTGLAALATGRRAVLSDLGAGAVHVAYNQTHPADSAQLMAAAESIMTILAKTEESLYASSCPTCSAAGQRLRHVVWSDVHRCVSCGIELVLWDAAQGGTRSVPNQLVCASCSSSQKRKGVRATASRPVQKTVACARCRKLQDGELDMADLALLAKLSSRRLSNWVPDVPLDGSREMYRRSALHLHDVSNVADFFGTRSKHALGSLWKTICEVKDERLRSALSFAFTNTAWHSTRMRRYNSGGGQRPMTGTLYIPQLVAEPNVFTVFMHQVKQVSRLHRHLSDIDRVSEEPVTVRRSDATDLGWIPSGTIDYVFTDPPFGSNIFYADCNVVWESWIGDVTDTKREIVVNRSLPSSAGGKSVDDYEGLLAEAFGEVRRVMKPDARATVVFHNSDDSVWTALLAAAETAGLRQTNVTIIDKVQRSMKGYKGRSGAELVPFYDLAITFASQAAAPPSINGAGDIARAAVADHLQRLAVNGDQAESRTLEYLYSLSVGAVVAAGAKPDGLSLRNFQRILQESFDLDGRSVALPSVR